MSYVLAPGIMVVGTTLLSSPEVLVWATGWLAAGLGLWLHAVRPPAENSLELAVLEAGLGVM
ncbi:hypothetical protein AAFN86_05705 [Roseomonas sp. CAU 1739]|uniref:hypothetical protein n=1 Tax=Roseomonas sp. CAU 1739 TaxID=3140364 RepID=UPI00325B79D9